LPRPGLGQRDVAADQRHAQGQAGIGEQAMRARTHSVLLFFKRGIMHQAGACDERVSSARIGFRIVKTGHAASRKNFSIQESIFHIEKLHVSSLILRE
jgi:hypothetical protein